MPRFHGSGTPRGMVRLQLRVLVNRLIGARDFCAGENGRAVAGSPGSSESQPRNIGSALPGSAPQTGAGAASGTSSAAFSSDRSLVPNPDRKRIRSQTTVQIFIGSKTLTLLTKFAQVTLPAFPFWDPFSTTPTPIHRNCTISTPCGAPTTRVASVRGTRIIPQVPPGRVVPRGPPGAPAAFKPANHAPFSHSPQPKSGNYVP
jgi:hypothetical protein